MRKAKQIMNELIALTYSIRCGLLSSSWIQLERYKIWVELNDLVVLV